MKLPTEVMRGQAPHRRTERDYLGVLLETVSLEEWRAVVSNALAAAKVGDAAARHWLGTFLLGRPAHPAPSPLTVVGRLAGEDLVVEELARPLFNQAQYPLLYQEEAAKARIRDQVAAQRDLPAPLSPCARPTTGVPPVRPAPGHGFVTACLRRGSGRTSPWPEDEGLDGVADALASGLGGSGTAPLRHAGQTPAPMPTGD